MSVFGPRSSMSETLICEEEDDDEMMRNARESPILRI
jgi:hypothetical protein